MELPRTSPSGRKPASRTSKNSLTVRSEVKIDPALPGCSSASRRIASCGTPVISADCCVITAPALHLDFLPDYHAVPRARRRGSVLSADSHIASGRQAFAPDRLAALRVEREYRQARPFGTALRPGEMRDRGADDRRLRDVIARAFLRLALALVHAKVHALDDDALRAHLRHVVLQLVPCVVPGHVHQLGIAADLGVARRPPGLAS